jgi:hypothetical protein
MMRKPQLWALGCFLLVTAHLSWAQAVRKPGLWEMNSTTTWQKSPPLPPAMQGANNPFATMTRTTQVCLTQQMIDKYGVPISSPEQGCAVSNLALKATSMTAEMDCTGRMNIHMTMQSSWPSGNTAQGKIHTTGTMQMGASTVPIEYTVVSTSTYKGPDCGSVQPLPMPASK